MGASWSGCPSPGTLSPGSVLPQRAQLLSLGPRPFPEEVVWGQESGGGLQGGLWSHAFSWLLLLRALPDPSAQPSGEGPPHVALQPRLLARGPPASGTRCSHFIQTKPPCPPLSIPVWALLPEAVGGRAEELGE